MAKKVLAALWVCILLIPAGCAAPGAQGTVETPPATTMPAPVTATPGAAVSQAAEEYFPVLENVHLVYEGEGNEYAAYVADTEFAQGGKQQVRIDNGGTMTSRVYKMEGGKVIRVLSVPEGYVRENLLDAPEAEAEVLLQEPFAVGTAWDVENGQRSITGVDVAVTVPQGEYKALEVTTQREGSTTVDYYAKGVGLIQSVFRAGDMEVVSRLAALEKDMPFLQVVRLYYPGAEGSGLFYREVQLRLPTNTALASAVEEAYQVEPGKGAGRVFFPGTRILGLIKGTQDVVTVDLNRAFSDGLNTAGEAYEKGALQSVANTFGELYQVEKVIITIGGEPYRSSHIAMQAGEALSVSREGAQIIID